MRVYDLEADVYFGDITDEEVDWREGDFEDEDSDDEAVEAPACVIGILGFDPNEIQDEAEG